MTTNKMTPDARERISLAQKQWYENASLEDRKNRERGLIRVREENSLGVIVRGNRYDSIAAAARNEKLSRTRIKYCIKNNYKGYKWI